MDATPQRERMTHTISNPHLTLDARYLPAIDPPRWLVALLGFPRRPNSLTAWHYHHPTGADILCRAHLIRNDGGYLPRYSVCGYDGDTLTDALQQCAETPSPISGDWRNLARDLLAAAPVDADPAELCISALNHKRDEAPLLRAHYRPDAHRFTITINDRAMTERPPAEAVLTRAEAEALHEWLTKTLAGCP